MLKIPSFRAERSEDPDNSALCVERPQGGQSESSRVLETRYILDSRLRGNDAIPSLSSLNRCHSENRDISQAFRERINGFY